MMLATRVIAGGILLTICSMYYLETHDIYHSGLKFWLTDSLPLIFKGVITDGHIPPDIPTSKQNIQEINSYLKRLTDIKKYTFIDFGAGEGNAIEYSVNDYQNLIGIELDENIATAAKQRLHDYSNVEILNMNMLNYTFNNTDTVLFLYEPLWQLEEKQAAVIYHAVFNNLCRAFTPKNPGEGVGRSDLIVAGPVYISGQTRKDLDVEFFSEYNLVVYKTYKTDIPIRDIFILVLQ
eukprot:39585_1